MNRLPKIVTSHSGMDARKPTFPMAALISPGNVPTFPRHTAHLPGHCAYNAAAYIEHASIRGIQ